MKNKDTTEVSKYTLGHANLKSGFSTKSIVELTHAQLNHKVLPLPQSATPTIGWAHT